MILRVYAMWNRSKTILGVLLFIYVPQVLVNVTWELVYARPGGTLSGMVWTPSEVPAVLSNTPTFSPLSPVTVEQVLDYTFCNYATTAPLATYRTIPRFVLGSALLILAVIPTLTHSVEMYKLTKRWHTNRTMELLVREGAVYFVVYVSLVPLCRFYMPIPRPCLTALSLPKSHEKHRKLTTRMLPLEPGICFSISSTRSKCPSSI